MDDPDIKTVESQQAPPNLNQPPKKTKKLLIVIVAGVAVVLLLVVAWLVWGRSTNDQDNSTNFNSTSEVTTASVGTLELDENKDYGNLYADGLLPVGDDKYSTASASVGTVYLCRQPNPNGGGAEVRGPWFTNNNTQYDINKKVSVEGSVSWQSSNSDTVSGSTRTIVTNDLPDHTTGVFPVQSSDPAYSYDRNPNTITEQSLTYALAANPIFSNTPSCVGGEAGVMNTGVALFNAFDDGGRDAGAWETQDGCQGHPQISGEYHYHTLSSCISDANVSQVIGYALDGFPITGPKVGDNNILTTRDLDECHGITSTVNIDGQQVKTYHYVMTQDFPYSVSCFRSTPIEAPH